VINNFWPTAIKVSHHLSALFTKTDEKQFLASSNSVEKMQRAILKKNLENISGSKTSVLRNVGRAISYEVFKTKFPITTYENWADLIQQQKQGEYNVLTNQPCFRYQPTSGSTSKIKWIPYNQAFLSQLDQAVGPWLSHMYRRYPAIKQGKHYWSLSWVPSDLRNTATSSVNDDLQLLPWWKRLFMGVTMAVPEGTSLADSSEESLFATACYLVSCQELSLISVWSPTFALSLLDLIEDRRLDIIKVLNQGQWPNSYKSLSVIPAPRNKEAALILLNLHGKISAEFTKLLWPKLALISAWDTSSSAVWAVKLQSVFAHSEFQGKGLWATEGVITIPYEDKFPLAINSHFYEFEDLSSGEILASWQLKTGLAVRPIITCANGIFRYAMNDQLLVTDFVNDIPCLEFIGRMDGIDMVGEKLSPQVAIELLKELDDCLGITPVSLLGVPGSQTDEKARYVLLCNEDSDQRIVDISVLRQELQQRLETKLQAHFHYNLARELGQLAMAGVVILKDAIKFYEDAKIKKGMSKGNIKIEPLIMWDAELYSEIECLSAVRQETDKNAASV